MAKEMKLLASYTEFAPDPVIPVRKVSHAPLLETILEEAEECDQELLVNIYSLFDSVCCVESCSFTID
ncbi:hypothetical protein VIGAN_08277100 [Vigna angularis var. angularis]|uniref:Uncharacterized protein n=1 Tax=Vigna angularis var. angularis TaxID=157739 RepID=A0A0S3SSZ1_PHAAN|nr:hypothetical protein VIGAN_08277100 [Vigna angularis var. angularis]